MIKPRKIQKGDTIAIISPSAGSASLFPHRLDNAIKYLESEGYKVKEYSSTRKRNEWESAPAEERAKDIMDAFRDKEVKAIICSIGGTVANQTLKFLDFKEIRENAKIFCGYSDISTLHYALYTQSDMITFYGPCAMTQFGEYPKPLDYTLHHFFKAISSTKNIGEIKPSHEWTDETLDWGKKLDLQRPRKMKENKGYTWLRKGIAEGNCIGGCLSSIIHLAGTIYWPEYKNKIVFLEIPEGQKFDEGEPLSYVDWFLEHLYLTGVFKEVKGLIFGRPYKYTEEDEEKLKQKIIERTKEYNFPIVYRVDIGHTDPMITLPIGVRVSINSNENSFKILESGVR